MKPSDPDVRLAVEVATFFNTRRRQKLAFNGAGFSDAAAYELMRHNIMSPADLMPDKLTEDYLKNILRLSDQTFAEARAFRRS